jgi:hypothetical protein
MSEGLGLVIDATHEATVNSCARVPVSFGVVDRSSLPPRWVPPLVVENQGRTNSCAGHAKALACSHANFIATGEVVRFSRRFAYITAQIHGGFRGDVGTSIVSVLQAATENGCCTETTCPFQEEYSQILRRQAYEEALKHRHHGNTRYDCRDLDIALNWITDAMPRCIVIGTKWMSGQEACTGIEDRRCGTSGSFRGYHARLVVGWDTVDGVLVPVVQNSHGKQWADHGRSRVMPDLWEEWKRDPNFCAFGFNRIDEIVPERKSWAESKPGDVC